MKRKLDRVLRIRQLLEDLAQMDFARQAAELRSLEVAAAGQRRRALAAQAEAWNVLGSEGTRGWLTGIADAEILAWKGGRLAALAALRRPEREAARGLLLARRLDRRQVEILAAAAARTEQQQQIRREQKAVDDWFQRHTGRGPEE